MRLENGQSFPAISAPRVGGSPMMLPGDIADGWAVLLFYRGHW